MPRTLLWWMRLLLVLPDDAQRQACADYFVFQGCEVDVASDAAAAQSLLRFRDYDAVTANGEATETKGLLSLARRRNAAVLPVVLTTNGPADVDPSVITLTKPFSLGLFLELARERMRQQASEA